MSDETLEKQKLFAELERLRREADDLKKSKQDLETRLENVVRQADAAEDRLLKEQEASVNKLEFAISTGGELRGLLNSEIDMAQSLLNTDIEKEKRDWVKRICRSQEYVLNIVNDILDFLKIEEGKLELEEEPFDLRACVEESLDCLASVAAKKGLSLTYMIAENTPDILMGDIARLRKILVELLNNAVKFTGSGEVAVSVTARNTKTAAHEVHFAVRDTGAGISLDLIQCLFQSSISREHHGYEGFEEAGLGLRISKRLSELMGGRIWAESEKNKGSVFHFTIKARAGRERPYAWLWRTDPQLAGKHLLICSENAADRNIVTRYARNWGMLVEEMELFALEKKEVWRVSDVLHQNGRWDVAVLDSHVPKEEIPVLLDGISNAPPSLPLAVLVSTCHSLSYAQERFVGCLAKPLKPAKLHAVLKEILGIDVVAARTVTPAGKKQIDKTKSP